MSARKDLAPQLADLRQRLGAGAGQKYWRTLEELADSPAFQELLRDEFPEQAAGWGSPLNRRQFLTLMGASLALAGVSGCSTRPAPAGEIVPYVRAPEEIVPGRPLFYATVMALGGAGVGLLVESHMGRPTKVEGNPDHPASRGATDLYHQASVLTLYDPDRSQTVTLLGQTSTWDAALGELPVGKVPSLGSAVKEQRRKRGAGLRVLSEAVVSPTLGRQVQDFLKAFPEAKWHQYEPLSRDGGRRGGYLAFGEYVDTVYDFTKADVVLSLDSDFLSCGPGSLRYVADYMSRRRVRDSEAGKAQMNRLYVVETAVTPTGAKADHRLALPGQEIEGVARAVAARLGAQAAGAAEGGPHEKWVAAVAKDLDGHRGRCVVLVGDRQPPAVHLLAHVLNVRLGNVGQTVTYTECVEARAVDHSGSLRELVEDMDRGKVEVLVILGGNPVYTAPADFHFTESMQKVGLRAHLSLYQDETSRQCHWHLPEAHYLEAWGDARAFDGTAAVAQPLIQPLYQGRSVHELMSAITDRLQAPGRDLVRAYWRRHWEGRGSSGSFEQFWQTALHDGVIPETAFGPKKVSLASGWEKHLQAPAATPAGDQGLELVFQQAPTIYDGRFANNGWLQELPEPITRLTWDNAAIMSPNTAKQLGVWFGAYAHGGEHGGYHMPLVELEVEGEKVLAPAWIQPGHADRSITVWLGYGRENAGRVGGTRDHKVGVNAYPLRTSGRPWFVPGLSVRKAGGEYVVACVQQHHLMEGREPVRVAPLEEYREQPRFAHERDEAVKKAQLQAARKPLTMYHPQDYGPPKNKWGMAIDLTACTGCAACVVACQAENNIPVVGKDQVAAGREMHWLRIDRYLEGTFDEPAEFHFQPVPCMHCENAPCEYVCPVAATVHSYDGLNDMVYQRCVGTRFCSNNCPYKVRRFNFFQYADWSEDPRRLQYNPDVTVRSRGVMEKCSYCVQRIRHAQIDAEAEGRTIRDGEVLTACQAACPAGAIVFGDINDPKSQVKRLKDTPLNYALLDEVNTRPRTTYLAAVRNPNPELEPPGGKEAE
jgi:MoCo/4Fe-4S cofactor protein with predicted Tat translocation signal